MSSAYIPIEIPIEKLFKLTGERGYIYLSEITAILYYFREGSFYIAVERGDKLSIDLCFTNKTKAIEYMNELKSEIEEFKNNG